MRSRKILLFVCVLSSVFLFLAEGKGDAVDRNRVKMQMVAANALCGGAYDCGSMAGTCCCLCGMNYGCVNREECGQNPQCVCRQPEPQTKKGRDKSVGENIKSIGENVRPIGENSKSVGESP